MSTSHIPHLRAVPSSGPRRPIVASDIDSGTRVISPQPSHPCGGCQRMTTEGEMVTKYRRSWWHAECANRDVEAGNAQQAWLALGHDLARSPRSYNVGESRAIVGALLGMIADPGEWAPSDGDYSPAIGGAS